jgi:outer membrane protein, multidrug efflux system
MSARPLLVLAIASSLSSCAVGPDYAPPHVAMPPAWQEALPPTSADPSTLERWWTGFHDPLLERLVARAIEGNLDLKIAAARVQEARALRGIAESKGKPQVDLAAQLARGERSDAVPPFKGTSGGSSPFGPRTQNTFEAGFDAGWELDVFGGVRRDVEAAEAEVHATEESRRDVLVTLVADVARNYGELRGTQRQIEILEDTVSSQRDTLGLAKARFDAGLATALDVDRAEGLLETTLSRRPELERAEKRAIYRLGVLLGEEPGAMAAELQTPRALPILPPELPEVLPSELLSRRPDLRRAERELAASTARVGVARADLFPRFSIGGNFGRRSEDASDLATGGSQFWFLVAGVRLPILSGGRIRAHIRAQSARQEEALRQYEKAVLLAVEEVENALVGYTRDERRQEALLRSVAANRRAMDYATDRYTGGLENFLSVLDAQRELYAAEDGLAESETSKMVSLIAVYKALGGGWTREDGQERR